MELRALRYFVELVKTKNFTVAAEHMHVSQPTMSKMVRTLEEDVGSPLLLRHGRKIDLTDAGMVVYNRGLDVIKAFDQLKYELQDLNSLAGGSVTIGVASLAGVLFTPAIAKFRTTYPRIDLRILENVGTKAVETALLNGNVEFGTVLDPVDNNIFQAISISQQQLHLVTPRQPRWESMKQASLQNLQNEAFILYDSNYALNEMIFNACRTAGFTPSVACRSGQWDFIASLVSTGLGVTLLPASYCERLNKEILLVIPLSTPELRWNVAMAWRRDARLSRAASAWLTVARETFPPPEVSA